jgi:hypothetical protein
MPHPFNDNRVLYAFATGVILTPGRGGPGRALLESDGPVAFAALKDIRDKVCFEVGPQEYLWVEDASYNHCDL